MDRPVNVATHFVPLVARSEGERSGKGGGEQCWVLDFKQALQTCIGHVNEGTFVGIEGAVVSFSDE